MTFRKLLFATTALCLMAGFSNAQTNGPGNISAGTGTPSGNAGGCTTNCTFTNPTIAGGSIAATTLTTNAPSTTRQNLASVTQRQPTINDYTGYAVGALWHAPGNWWQLQRLTSATSTALWQALPVPPHIAVTPAFVYGTRALVSGYTGNLFDLKRMSDLTTQTFAAIYNGLPDLSAMATFCSGTICRYTTAYEQTGSGFNATQTGSFAMAPRMDLTILSGGAPGMVFDYSADNTFAGSVTGYAVTSFTGTTITLTATPTYQVEPGWTYTGAGTTGTVSSVDSTGKILTVTGTPTSTAAVTFAFTSHVGLDLPAGVALTAKNQSAVFTVVRPPSLPTASPIIDLGATAAQANNSVPSLLLTFKQAVFSNPGVEYYMGGGGSCPIITSGLWGGNKVQIMGVNHATTGYTLYIDSQSQTFTSGCQYTGATAAGTIGYSQQAFGTLTGSDMEFYGAVVYNRTLAAADVATTQAGINDAFGLTPQVLDKVIYDGSSTTSGVGTDITNSQPRKTSRLLQAVWPNVPYNIATGGTIEVSLTQYQWYPGYFYDPTHANILVFHPGFGNSIQGAGTGTVTAQSGNVLTINSVNTNFAQGAWISGTNIPANTQILAATATNITISNAPTGTVGTITALSDCGSQAWANIVAYLQQARASGYKIVLVGSASRGTFSGTSTCGSGLTQTQEFYNAKAMMYNHWSQYADAYVDLFNDPAMGDAAAGGATTVTGISGNQVTVSAVSADAAVNSYVQWPGMPDQGVSITAISGNVLTLSATPAASMPTLYAINIAPWTANPTYWLQTADQHFLDLGYEAHAAMIAPAVLGILPQVGK